jgi:hypothetical protein
MAWLFLLLGFGALWVAFTASSPGLLALALVAGASRPKRASWPLPHRPTSHAEFARFGFVCGVFRCRLAQNGVVN